MSLATSNRDGGRTSESGHLRAIQKVITGEVLTGLNVSQRSAGANMSVDVAIGDAIIPRADGTYGHPAWNDAVYNQVIGTADVSNPRRDIVVMYIDYSVTPSTGVSNNTNGVVKISVVAGTPAGSPVDPSDAAIQSAVGASNPFIKLARVRVAAGAGSVTNSVIDDLRLMAQGILQGGWTFDDLYTWVYGSASTFTIAGVDARSQFPIGTKLALYQSGVIKYFIVSGTAFATNTTVTVDGLGTYTLTNVPIDRAAYSYMLTPQGLPVGPTFNPYKFSAIGSAGSTAIATGAYTKFPFDTKVFDTGTNYNTTNRQFVAPVAGFYQFSAGIRIDAAGSGALYKMILSKNGTGTANTVEGNAVTSSGAAQVRLEVSGLMQLAAGDTIEVDYYGSQAGNMFPNGSHFSGYLVSIV